MSSKRAIVYIDGFNLYYGLKAKHWKRYYWIDPYKLAGNLIHAGEMMTVSQVHYFTAPVLRELNEDAAKRHGIYLSALKTLPQLTIHLGTWIKKTVQCRKCGATWIKPEEKMSDVNIAVQMVQDAYEDCFDTAFLVSGDSDLMRPIKAIRDRCPGKDVRVAFPPKRRSWHLANIAHSNFMISKTTLRDSQLPEQVTNEDGYVLRRPETWY